jgi:hypothetical protein
MKVYRAGYIERRLSTSMPVTLENMDRSVVTLLATARGSYVLSIACGIDKCSYEAESDGESSSH